MSFSSSDPVEVLHVDDDREFLGLVAATLERTHPHFRVHSVTSVADALAYLATSPVDCVVTDYRMPEKDGLDFLRALRKKGVSVPTIFFTGRGSEDIAHEAIIAGVTDYLRKGAGNQLTLLGNRIEVLVGNQRAEGEVEEARERVQEMYDRITEALVSLDADFRVTSMNAHAEDLFDAPAGELLGRVFWDIYPELARGRFGREVRRSVQKPRSSFFEVYSDSLGKWLSIVTYPDEQGVTLFMRDVTEYKEFEAELDEMRDELAHKETQFNSLKQKLTRPGPDFR